MDAVEKIKNIYSEGLSIGILIHDEFEELSNLFKALDNNIFKFDKIKNKTLYEIIIVHDTTNISKDKEILVNKIFKLINEYKDKWAVHIRNNKDDKLIRYYTHDLNNDFAQQRNYLNSKCTKKYILQIDADELPSKNLLYDYMNCFEKADDDNYPLVAIPRINVVDGITNEFLNKWGWNITTNGWINFPDYQIRLYKNNPNKYYWIKPVHEVMSVNGDFNQEFINILNASKILQHQIYLYHKKDINKQISQNEFYSNIINN